MTGTERSKHMAIGKFVSYLRVSTAKQGRSGLGLEAQRAAITDYLNGGRWKLLAEYVEVETGKKDDRPKLQEALHYAKVTGATLVVAKLDRLSRNVEFIARLQNSKVKFICADLPELNEMTIGILAVVAQHERKVIGERTRAAMRAAKKRPEYEKRKASGDGKKKFGNPAGAKAFGEISNDAAVEAIKSKADKYARDIMIIINDIKAGGVTTLQGIADELNERGMNTARNGQWYPTTVRNLLQRTA
jgi:DNA invertase Pin-like site-specific DNA recombinase